MVEGLKRRPIYRGKFLDLGIEEARFPDGSSGELEVVRHPGAAATVPLTTGGEVLLIRQWRHAAGGWLLEAPAGKLDPGESPEACARRETAEEIGFEPRTLVPLGGIWTSPGFTDERIWLFLARELEPTPQALEEDEHLSIVRLPFERVVELALEGQELTDAKTAIAILRAARYLG